MLIVNNLTSYYSNIKILKELSFNLNQGQVLCTSRQKTFFRVNG